LAQALSQVASRYAPLGRYDDARAAAEEALRLAGERGAAFNEEQAVAEAL
jgi:hypothetical protein